MRLIRSASYKRMPWKNGGGMLADIIAMPEGSDLHDFDWRLSAAHVGRDGPFSIFLDVDRVIAVTHGQGLRLEIAGMPAVTLGPQSPAFGFPGDAATEGFLTDGPVDDLNVMTRRGRYAARMRWLDFDGDLTLHPVPSGATLVVLNRGRLDIDDTFRQEVMEAGDTLLLSRPTRLSASDPARGLLVEIETAAGT